MNEAGNLRYVLPQLSGTLSHLVDAHEIIVVDGASTDGTRSVVGENGARYISQPGRGYGDALITGIEAASGEYILTMDADLSHSPAFVSAIWAARSAADIVIASRYVEGGTAEMAWSRSVLSRILNWVFGFALSLPVRDLSSGYRLYRAPVAKGMGLRGTDFDVLQEILVRAYVDGWSVAEIPFHYAPRRHGSSHARLMRFGISYLRTLGRMWRLRYAKCGLQYAKRWCK